MPLSKLIMNIFLIETDLYDVLEKLLKGGRGS